MMMSYEIAKDDLEDQKKKVLKIIDHIFMMYQYRESSNEDKPKYNVILYNSGLSMIHDAFELLLESIEDNL